MGDKRKLQGEIDRCLKKVGEGVEIFEDIWDKVHSATNANQKEKYEADLKKEIKKLQRLRDQIKTWAASNEIKDKKLLLDNRKLIETQMERFKVVERETKTKAYSKEGLGLASKVDPAQKERVEMTQWLSECIDKLQLQVDSFEMELESLKSQTKKRKVPTELQSKIQSLEGFLDRHPFHVVQLETIMRMLDNNKLDVDQIKTIQEDVEYYIDSHDDPDFEENLFMYDDLNLDESDLVTGQVVVGTPEDNEDMLKELSSEMSKNLSTSVPTTNHSTENNKEEERKRTKSSTSESDSSSPRKITTPSKISSSSQNVSTTQASSNALTNNRPTVVRATSVPATLSSSNTNSTSSNTTFNNSTSRNGHNKTNSVSSTVSTSPHTVAQPPSGPAYAVAAGATQHNSSQGAVNHYRHAVSQQPQISPSATLPGNPSHPVGTHFSPQAHHSRVHPSRPDWTGPQQAFNMSPLGNSLEHVTSSVPSSVPTNSHIQSPLTVHTNSQQPQSQPLQPQQPQQQQQQQLPTQQQQQQQQQAPTPSQPTSQPHTPRSMYNSVSGAPLANNPTAEVPINSEPLTNGPISPVAKEDNGNMSSLKLMAQKVVISSGLESSSKAPGFLETTVLYDSTPLIETAANQPSTTAPTPIPTGGSLPVVTSPASQTTGASTQLQETIIPRLRGVAPLGPVTLTKDQLYQQSMMEAAFLHPPHPSDSERLRLHLPRNPYPTPLYHCQFMPPRMDSLEFFMRLSTETLFFIFYYQEGTRAQYLAAKALKRQSWRFHTKYMMWFQRHEEPKTITDEFEQGTYIYFDYEKWGQRKKEGFTFEYRYLEDREL
ncbi:CCR4-NOT transcription complex subunit 3 [Holothuria leucospilota]|uniref:CCR4-NOT transcription complex subunit 3 n=1 Tax=Holothuria leucospilota TaxID=206669 RepID=A0A9Q1C450_HOLLE|nr:CCR4-NOT transcription complex subunit 3 [Holothuria leucospilota]